MEIKSLAQTMFLLVVAEGAAIGQVELVDPADESDDTFCQLELLKKNFQGVRDPADAVEERVCLDGKTTEEIVELIEDSKEEQCATPFCGCWLG